MDAIVEVMLIVMGMFIMFTKLKYSTEINGILK